MSALVESPKSRRRLLAGLIGGVVASIAAAAGRPTRVEATHDGYLQLSHGNGADAVTFIETSAAMDYVFAGSHLGSGMGLYGYSGSGTAVRAEAGAGSPALHATSVSGHAVLAFANGTTGASTGVTAYASSTSGAGVIAEATAASGVTLGVIGRSSSPSGTGVHGHATAGSGATIGVGGRVNSTTGTAVHAFALAASGQTRGVLAQTVSSEGTAIQGYSGIGDPPAPLPKTGVYGHATQDAAARGVVGKSTAGYGVQGIAVAGRGVFGQATSGQGVRGYATSGTAGYFGTPVSGTTNRRTGTALRVAGRMSLDNCSGITTIANNTNVSAVVTPGIALTADSAVVATLLGGAGAATTTVGRVAVNTTNHTFRVYLTANNTSGAPVRVAWHVFG